MGDLTHNFSRSEFACKCGCGFDNVNLALVNTLQEMRDYIRTTYNIDQKFLIRSGCRCAPYNVVCGGKKKSAHLNGDAVDLKAYDSRTRYLFTEAAMHSGIKRIGWGKTFVHVDVAENLDQLVGWLY